MKLTLPQQDVYLDQLRYPDLPIYNIGAKIEINGTIDINAFKRAYEELINQHDTFRALFSVEDEKVITEVSEKNIDELPVIDFSDTKDAQKEADRFIQEQFRKPFNIFGNQFLHRFLLIKINTKKFYLFSVYHHLITDGWGTSLMFQRLVKNYNEIITQGSISSEYPFSYQDFAKDDIEYEQSEAYQKDKAYWTQRFSVLPDQPFTASINTNNQIKSERAFFYIKRNQYDELEALGKKVKASTFHLILSLIFIYFSKRNNLNDLVIGIPVLNRGKSIFKKTVGLFMGVSPLRLAINFEQPYADFVAAIRNQLRSDYRHQRFPLGKLLRELNTTGTHTPLFNITLSYEKQNYADHFEDTETIVLPMSHGAERVALAIYIREFDSTEDVKIDFDYNINYFDKESIEKTIEGFKILLQNVLNYPEKPIYLLEYLSDEEKNIQLHKFNKPLKQINPSETFLTNFEKNILEFSDRTAVKDEFTSLSYKDLNRLATQLAKYLLKHYPKERIIGVEADRSVLTIVMLLGIFKAGKSYVPLDPVFPKKRLQYIADHSGLSITITNKSTKTNDLKTTYLLLEKVLNNTTDWQDQQLPSIAPYDTAYIIYTSGSTGDPKGVEISHYSLLNFLRSMQDKPGITKDDLFFAVTTFSFDISILEFFGPLIAGGCSYVASNHILEDTNTIIDTIHKIEPTIMQATPSFYQLLLNGGWRIETPLKILCGGDLLSEDLASHLLQDKIELWNMYGPTETTIWSSVKKISYPHEASNIGKPINNTRFYVLDSYKQLLPIGSKGILYISGHGVAKGYHKNKELSREKICIDLYPGESLFNTNDLVQWTNKGELRFLGRNDHQVKIRGFRIELGDIESNLNALPSVDQAIVCVKKELEQEAFLAAYIKKNEDINLEYIKTSLEKVLPYYMIPSLFQEVDEFPLTYNNKIDRKKLIEKPVDIAVSDISTLPSTKLQKKLARFWNQVLATESEISTEMSFFSIGGHSLRAIRLSSLINEEFGTNLGMKDIFENTTIKEQIELLKTSGYGITDNTIPKSQSKQYYVVTPAQYQLWVASQSSKTSTAYNMISAFNLKGEVNLTRMNNAMRSVIVENEILRTNFVNVNGSVRQKIRSIEDLDFEIMLVNLKEEERGRFINMYVNTPFDLEEDLLLKMCLLQIKNADPILLFCSHHIILDGISTEYLFKGFLEKYEDPEIPKKAMQKLNFKDYSEWIYQNFGNEENLSFWKNYLQNYQKTSYIPKDKIEYTYEKDAGYLHHVFTSETSEAIDNFIKVRKSTSFNLLISILNLVIYCFDQSSDIVIGITNSGRTHSAIQDLIGMFVKIIPLRINIKKELCFKEFLKQVQDQVLLLNRRQDAPASMAHKFDFDILMSYQNPDFSYQETLDTKNLSFKYLPVESDYSRLPLLLNFFEVNKILHLTICYNKNWYQYTTVQSIIETFESILTSVINNSEIQIQDVLNISLDDSDSEDVSIDLNF
jgi:amino acid adenylation domain-containing protein